MAISAGAIIEKGKLDSGGSTQGRLFEEGEKGDISHPDSLRDGRKTSSGGDVWKTIRKKEENGKIGDQVES